MLDRLQAFSTLAEELRHALPPEVLPSASPLLWLWPSPSAPLCLVVIGAPVNATLPMLCTLTASWALWRRP